MSDPTFLDLPFDILSKIFKKLTLSDLGNVMLTCKTLRTFISEDNTIWRHFTKFFVRNSLGNRQPTVTPYTLCRVSRNWCNGIYKPKILNYNTKYMPWLTFHNSEAVVISLGSTICSYPTNKQGLKDGGYVWRVEVPIVKRNDIRTNDVSRFLIKNDLIVCGNRDGCAIVYEFKSTKQRPHLLHHIRDCHDEGHSEVSAVELIHTESASIVVSASGTSPDLCYWYIKGKESDTDLCASQRHHDTLEVISAPHIDIAGLRCLALNKSQTKLTIGPNGNSKPLLVDVTTSKFVSYKDVIPEARQAVRDVQWHDENTIAYVTHAGKLQFIDTRTFQVVYDAKDPFLVTLYCVKTDGDRAILAGSAAHSRCVLYDRRNPSCHVQLHPAVLPAHPMEMMRKISRDFKLYKKVVNAEVAVPTMYFTSKKSSPVYSLDFDSTRLIAAADNNLVSLNFNTRADKRRQRDYSSFDFKIA